MLIFYSHEDKERVINGFSFVGQDQKERLEKSVEKKGEIKVVIPIGFFNRIEGFFCGAGFFGGLETRALHLAVSEIKKIGANIGIINSVGYGCKSLDEYSQLCEVNISWYKSN